MTFVIHLDKEKYENERLSEARCILGNTGRIPSDTWGVNVLLQGFK